MRINYLENRELWGVSSYKSVLSTCNCCLLILSFTTNDIYRPSVQSPQYFQAYEI